MNMKKLLFLVLFLGFTPLHCWPPSLANCGNTCFLNASLQVLYNIHPLTDYLKIENYYSVKNAPTPYYYSKLIRRFEKTKNPNRSVPFSCTKDSGRSLLKQLDSVCYKLIKLPEWTQQDATELITAFLNDLIENGPLRLKSYLKTLYQFQQNEETRCPAIPVVEEYKGIKTKNEILLKIPVENKDKESLTSLKACLNEYFTVENLIGENKYKDERIGGGTLRDDCTRQFKLQNSPKILLIGLNRFTFIGGTPQKVDHSVFVPTYLNIANFVVNGEQNEAAHNFDLIDVVIQSGSLTGGHYWAYVKDETGQWFNCNDSSISKVSITDPKVIAEINGGTPGAGTGYILCYQKRLFPQEQQNQKKAINKARIKFGAEELFRKQQKKEERKRAQELQNLSNQLNQLTQQLQKLNQDLRQI